MPDPTDLAPLDGMRAIRESIAAKTARIPPGDYNGRYPGELAARYGLPPEPDDTPPAAA